MDARSDPASAPATAVRAARSAKPALRAWQRMLSGRRLNLLDPSPLDVEIEDIAHGLSRVARWNGQTAGAFPFSVAQHSVLVERICVRLKPDLPPRWRLAALLHDAPEYVVGDLISPFKAAVGLNYKALEQRLMAAIHIRFGLPPQLPATVETLIKRADRASAYFEAVDLAGFSVAEARKLFTAPRFALEAPLAPLPPQDADAAFRKRFTQLERDIGSKNGPEMGERT